NDVWLLVDANGIGTPYWTQLLPIGNAPTPREYITSAYDSVNNRLIIFGGFEVTSSGITRFNDTWILTHANGLGGVPEWSPLAPNGTPPSPRSEASAIYNSASNEMILFGGLTSSVSTSNETWVLKNANGLDGTPEWVEIAISGDLPLGRWGQSTGFSPTSNNVVMAMGRNDTPNSSSLLNDVWVLGTTSLSIELDVKPNDSSNSLNPSSKGVIPVAILSTSEFDAMSVNPSSIRFGLNEATIVHKQGHI
ncbi:MAG: hypothetical protein KDE56_25445, partial [Anaerolineales bacterium]|nr:hypothetical protein [Anaerolineales bacterium]